MTRRWRWRFQGARFKVQKHQVWIGVEWARIVDLAFNPPTVEVFFWICFLPCLSVVILLRRESRG